MKHLPDKLRQFLSEPHDILQDLRDGVDPPPMLLPGMLPMLGLCIIAGVPGVGKTWFNLWLCLRLALGLPVLGVRPSGPKRVFYVSIGDDAAQILRYRLQLLLKGMRAELKGWPPGQVEQLLGQNFRLYDTKARFEDGGPHWDEIEELMEWADVGVVDPLAGIIPAFGDENSASDMQRLYDAFRLRAKDHQMLILFCVHFRKGARRTRAGSEDIRGSSAQDGAARGVIMIRKPQKKHGLPRELRQELSVQTRYDQPIQSMLVTFKIDPKAATAVMTWQVAVQATEGNDDPVRMATRADQGLVEAIKQLDLRGSFSAPQVARAAIALRNVPQSTDPKEQAKIIRKSLKRLMKKGTVEQHKVGNGFRYRLKDEQ